MKENYILHDIKSLTDILSVALVSLKFWQFDKFYIFFNRLVVIVVSEFSALAQPYGVGDAIESWLELLSLFLETN